MRQILCFLVCLMAVNVACAQGPSTGVSVQIQPLSGAGKFCVDVEGDRDRDGVPVFIYQCHGSENQRWTITSSLDDKHAIVGIGGYCLDVRGTTSRANGTPVQLWKCHFGPNQRFHLSSDGRIREVESGKCLIAVAAKDGAPLVLDRCTNTPDEVFVIRH